MFERSLSDLIKGLRSHRGKDEPKYVSLLLSEIRQEVRSGDLQVKSSAILKLTYLQMLGYPFASANFHMLETMASSNYHHKHIGYLAAAQCFSSDTEVLILATNMFKKDLQSAQPLHVAVALNGLAHIATADLARHLGPDVLRLLSHSRAMIRKKALLVLYSLIIKHPQLLQKAWDSLSDKLDDPDLGVVSAAVNIICELARSDARPFLPLSPQLFRLLTTSTNNWMLIKIIKLFGSLTPLEPRLVKKLVPPITAIISTTPAMSLLYECIHTIIIGGMLTQPDGDHLAHTCVEKLAAFLTHPDQNLKYIALLALVKILPSHPHLVAEHHQVIFESIEDADLSIRLRALELVSGMAVSRNLESIVHKLLSHLEPPTTPSAHGAAAAAAALKATLSVSSTGGSDADPTASSLAAITSMNNPTASPSYRLEIVQRILALGSFETYANVQDFHWYIDILVHLATVQNLPQGNSVGKQVSDQLIDITARVRAVRPYATRAMVQLLNDRRVLGDQAGVGGGDAAKVVHAAAWILGEYAYDLTASSSPAKIVPLLLQSTICDNIGIDAATKAACVHGAVKMYAFWASAVSTRWTQSGMQPAAEFKQIVETTNVVVERLDAILHVAADAELAERCAEYRQLFALIEADLLRYASRAAEGKEGEEEGGQRPPKSLDLLSPLFFNHTLGPLAVGAQAKVAPPTDMDLHAWIVDPHKFVVLDSITAELSVKLDAFDEPIAPEDAVVGESKSRAKRQADQVNDPFYISSTTTKAKAKSLDRMEKSIDGDVDVDVDAIPIVRLDELITEHKEQKRVPKVNVQRVLEAEEMPEPAVGVKTKKKEKKIIESTGDGDGDGDGAGAGAQVDKEAHANPTTVVKVTKKKKPTSKKASSAAGVVID